MLNCVSNSYRSIAFVTSVSSSLVSIQRLHVGSQDFPAHSQPWTDEPCEEGKDIVSM